MPDEAPRCAFCGTRLKKYTRYRSGSERPVKGEVTRVHLDNRDHPYGYTVWEGHYGYEGSDVFHSQRCGYLWALKRVG